MAIDLRPLQFGDPVKTTLEDVASAMSFLSLSFTTHAGLAADLFYDRRVMLYAAVSLHQTRGAS